MPACPAGIQPMKYFEINPLWMAAANWLEGLVAGQGSNDAREVGTPVSCGIDGAGDGTRIRLLGLLLVTARHGSFIFNGVWRRVSLLVIPLFTKSRKV